MAVAPPAPVRTVIEVTHGTRQEFDRGRRITTVYPAPREPNENPSSPELGFSRSEVR